MDFTPFSGGIVVFSDDVSQFCKQKLMVRDTIEKRFDTLCTSLLSGDAPVPEHCSRRLENLLYGRFGMSYRELLDAVCRGNRHA